MNLDAKIQRIRETMEREKEPSWHDLKMPNTGKIATIVWIGLALSVFQQFVGINVIFYYSNILWQAVGFTEDQSFVITVITATINILTTLIAIATIDRIGRKPLLVIGSVGMTITLATMAIIFGTRRLHRVTATCNAKNVTDEVPDLSTAILGSASADVALVAANLFVVAFGMSWGPGRVGAARRDVPEPDARAPPVAGRQRRSGWPTGSSPSASRPCRPSVARRWPTACTPRSRCCRSSSC